MTPQEFAASLVAAFASGDTASYFAHFHPDATFVFHDVPGRLESRAAYERLWAEWVQEAGLRIQQCTSSNAHLQELGDLAVFSHDVHTVREVEGSTEELRERETIVLHRDGDTWSCVHEHLSPDPGHAATT